MARLVALEQTWRATQQQALWSEEEKAQSLAGFYLVADEQAFLKKVKSILKTKGHVGFFDAAGRVHYYIEQGENPYACCDQVLHLSETLFGSHYDARGLNASIEVYIEDFLIQNDMPMELSGSRLFKKAAKLLYYRPDLLTPLNKGLLLTLGEQERMSPAQVERVMRYALKQSTLPNQIKLALVQTVQEVEKQVNSTQNP